MNRWIFDVKIQLNNSVLPCLPLCSNKYRLNRLYRGVEDRRQRTLFVLYFFFLLETFFKTFFLWFSKQKTEFFFREVKSAWHLDFFVFVFSFFFYILWEGHTIFFVFLFYLTSISSLCNIFVGLAQPYKGGFFFKFQHFFYLGK